MIKWISDHLGTAPHDAIGAHPDFSVIDVRDLVDKPGNLGETARKKIDEALADIQAGAKVVICCDYGMSRSNAVAAGVIALHQQIPFNDAVRTVMAATGEKEIKIEVLEAVRQALGQSPTENHNQKSTKRLLITGGSGFIGKSLVRRLAQRHDVHAPTREELDLGGSVELDLFIKEHDITELVHLANPRIYATTRAMGESLVLLENVLMSCRQNQIPLIYLSSWEVYSGYQAESLLATSSLPPLPKGVYGETKYLCETLIEHYQLQYGLKCALLRSSPVYGMDSDKPRFIFNFINKAIRNEEIITHRYQNGFPTLDLLFIDDLVAALAAAIERDVSGALNIGSGKSTNTAEVARLIVSLSGSRSTIHHSQIDSYTANVRMDIAPTAEKLGWKPRVELESGLQLLLESRRSSGRSLE